ncbi:sortase [Rubrobacter marinus]|uniref:Sortase n=2 Tax=Rubrobacter marinus TaxID=2653852 RepID=A0A6G8Q262_9ACTN|nr:sortase [Rubrobacter marinus]
MSLMDTKQRKTRPSQMRKFRQRRRTGGFIFAGLLVLILGALAFSGITSALSGGSETVERVQEPAVEEAPRAVSEEPAEEARAEEEAARQRAAEEEEARRAAEERRAEEERAAAEAARTPDDPTMYLTVPKLGVYSHTVRNDSSEEALGQGAIKVPGTGFPWEDESTNTYIAGHRIGWPGTESDYQFYNLPLMQQGDEVLLEDSEGRVYKYQVTEIFAVSPSDSQVMEAIPGRDVVSLQTCTETPNDWWTIGPSLYGGGPESGRLVVRADRVA